MSSHDIIGIFFDKMVDFSCYLVMLQLLVTKIFVHTQWFMQDRAKVYSAYVVLDFLHEMGAQLLKICVKSVHMFTFILMRSCGHCS
jgi:hypothetical protein